MREKLSIPERESLILYLKPREPQQIILDIIKVEISREGEMLKKIVILGIGILILGCFFTSPTGAWKKGLFDTPINTYAGGTIHFYGQAYKVTIEDYGEERIIVILQPEGAPKKEKRELYLPEWQSFMEEVYRVNSTVEELTQLGEKTKEVLTVKEFLQLKNAIRGQRVRVKGVTKDVKVKKGLLFYYTLFLLTDQEGNYLKVSLEGKHKVPNGKEVIVEGAYGEYVEEFKATSVVW